MSSTSTSCGLKMTNRARCDQSEITPRMAALMREGDRKALGVKLPEEVSAKADAGREAELQKLCEQELSRRGTVYLHLSPRAREKVGWPDLTFSLVRRCRCGSGLAGVPVAVELKTVTGKLSGEQDALLQRLSENGWETHVCRSFDAFLAILSGREGA